MEIVSIISLILDFVLALIAIIVSIVSIKRQTKEQELSNTIQLFEKRLNIYIYLENIFRFSGIIFAKLNIFTPNTTFEQFKNNVRKNKLSEYDLSSVEELLDEQNIIKNQALALFEPKLSKYIIETIELFDDFFNVILELSNSNKQATNLHYLVYKSLIERIHDKEEGGIVSKINDYIILYDIKRKLKYHK